MGSFCSKTDFTFVPQPISFEPLEINQSYISHLKVLLGGINATSSQWCGFIFILCYTHSKLALLLYKQGLVAAGVGTTVTLEDLDSSAVGCSLLLLLINGINNFVSKYNDATVFMT